MFDNNDPNFQLVAEEWPTFLYDEEAGWNVEKAENGLFRGHVLTRVGLCCHHRIQAIVHSPPPLGCPSTVLKQDCCSGRWARKVLQRTYEIQGTTRFPDTP